MNEAEHGKKMSRLIAKCWADDGFKQKLLADPAATLTAEGVEFPPGLSIKVVENNDKECHLVIPAKPTDLSDEDLTVISRLSEVSGIQWACGCGCTGYCCWGST